MSRVFQVTDLVGVSINVRPGDGRTRIGGTIINEQQLPVAVGLRQNTFDGVADKLFGVQENDDHGDLLLFSHGSTRAFDMLQRSDTIPPHQKGAGRLWIRSDAKY